MSKTSALSSAFAGTVRREQVKLFRETLPKTAAKLQAILNNGNNGRKRKLTAQVVFDHLYPKHVRSCRTCGDETAWGEDIGRYREFCGQRCMNSNPITLDRRRATNLARYGNIDPNQAASVKRKKVKTFRARYGVDNPSQAESVKQRKRETFRSNYGVDHWMQTEAAQRAFGEHNPMYVPAVKAKLARTNIKRYGVGCVFQAESVKAKSRKTCLAKYGVENAGATALGFKRKHCTDRFGKTHVVQGYEPMAVAWLSARKDVSLIVTDSRSLPRISYGDSTYSPDIMVRRGDKDYLIEVKGSWPLRKCLTTVAAKCKAATKYMEARGGEFWLYYFTDKHRLIRLRSPTIQQLRALLEER